MGKVAPEAACDWVTVCPGTIVGRGDGVSNGSATDSGIIVDGDVAGQAMVGFSLSVTMTSKEQLAELPLASVTIKVLVVVPMGEMWLRRLPCGLGDGLSRTVVGGGNEYHNASATRLAGSLLTVIFAGQAMVGFSLSVTMTSKEQLARVSAASVTIKVLVVVPMGNVAPEASPADWVTVCPGQLSEDVMEKVTAAPQTPGSLLTVIFAGQAMVGFSLSVTMTSKEHLAVLPDASVTIKVLVVVPMGNVAPEASPADWVTVCPGQLWEEVTE